MDSRLQRPANQPPAAPIHQATTNTLRRAVVMGIAGLSVTTCLAAVSARKPQHLACDSMDRPLGIDSAQPSFSWQLQDTAFAARQTAYRIEVATKPALLAGDKPDVWDSGRIASDKSFGVTYGGPGLAATTRYYWRVELWDKDGKPYPASDVSWCETGLLRQDWKAQWIGYEDQEHRAVRESGAAWITNADNAPAGAPGGQDSQHDFRFKFLVDERGRHYMVGRNSPQRHCPTALAGKSTG